MIRAKLMTLKFGPDQFYDDAIITLYIIDRIAYRPISRIINGITIGRLSAALRHRVTSVATSVSVLVCKTCLK